MAAAIRRHAPQARRSATSPDFEPQVPQLLNIVHSAKLVIILLFWHIRPGSKLLVIYLKNFRLCTAKI